MGDYVHSQNISSYLPVILPEHTELMEWEKQKHWTMGE